MSATAKFYGPLAIHALRLALTTLANSTVPAFNGQRNHARFKRAVTGVSAPRLPVRWNRVVAATAQAITGLYGKPAAAVFDFYFTAHSSNNYCTFPNAASFRAFA